MKIDVNCDIGEIEENLNKDLKLLNYVSSINLACGFHAGNYQLMDIIIDAAMSQHIKIGAHPGYQDVENFGRQPVSMGLKELNALISYQVGALKTMVESKAGKLNHVKLHGALYNLATNDQEVAEQVAKTITSIDDQLIVYGMYDSALAKACERYKLTFKNECFADRYYDNLALAPRKSGGVIESVKDIIHQCIGILEKQEVKDINNKIYHIECDTLCVHGDHLNSLEVLMTLNKELTSIGYHLEAE